MAVSPDNQGPAPGARCNGSAEASVAAEPREAGRPVRAVRYGAMGWVGEFSSKAGLSVPAGTKVVIQTERGIELGEPVGAPCGGCNGCDLLVPRGALQAYIRNSGQEFCRPRAGRILRPATAQDVNEHAHLNAHLREDIDTCVVLAAELGLDIKIITAEHLLGGERIVFYFGSPARVDFRQLVRELAQRYRTRIEMRQVGARDEARLVADYEVCGRECCCRNFLKKLRPVNMKMAKLQKSTLDPSKVSGRCGRLRCCLRYEHLGYEELAARLPRVGSRVRVEAGTGTVIEQQILTQLLLIRLDDNVRITAVPLEEVREFNLPPLPKEPAATGAAPAGETQGPAATAGLGPDRNRRNRRRRRRDDIGGPAEPDEAAAEEPPSMFVPEPAVPAASSSAARAEIDSEHEGGLREDHVAGAAGAPAGASATMHGPEQAPEVIERGAAGSDKGAGGGASETEPPAAAGEGGPGEAPRRRRRRGRRRRRKGPAGPPTGGSRS